MPTEAELAAHSAAPPAHVTALGGGVRDEDGEAAAAAALNVLLDQEVCANSCTRVDTAAHALPSVALPDRRASSGASTSPRFSASTTGWQRSVLPTRAAGSTGA